MRRFLPMLTIALAIVVSPSTVMADDAKEKKELPPKRSPAAWFETLDADNDGKLTVEELPEARRERLERLLVRADSDGDGVVTSEEFVAAMKDRPDRRRPPRGERPEWGDRGPDGPPRDKKMGPPDLEKLFERFDADGDEQLSVEEFTKGMKRLGEKMRREGPSPAMAWRHDDPRRRHPGPHARPPRPSKEMIEKMRQRGKEMFDRADADGDGKLSREEASERLKEHFDKIDADGDGQLTPEELEASWKSRVKSWADRPAKDKKDEKDSPVETSSAKE